MLKWRKVVLVVLTAALLVLAGCGTAPAPSSSAPAPGPAGPAPAQPVVPAAAGRVAAIKQLGKLRVGWAEYNPFEYRDPSTNQLTGILIDIPKALAKTWGVEVQFVEDAWPTLTTATAAGQKWDLAFMGITPARAEQVDFSDSIYHTDFTLMVRKNAGFTKFEDVDQVGRKIVVTTGSNTDEALTARVKHAEIVRVKDVANVLLQLTSGKVDAMATQRDYLARRAAEFPEYTVLPDNFGQARMAIAVAKKQPEYLAAINAFIKEHKRSGFFQKLIDQYKLVGNEVSP